MSFSYIAKVNFVEGGRRYQAGEPVSLRDKDREIQLLNRGMIVEEYNAENVRGGIQNVRERNGANMAQSQNQNSPMTVYVHVEGVNPQNVRVQMMSDQDIVQRGQMYQSQRNAQGQARTLPAQQQQNNQQQQQNKYIAKVPFVEAGRNFEPGNEIVGLSDDRIKELEGSGLVELKGMIPLRETQEQFADEPLRVTQEQFADDPAAVLNEPRHVGGGWYELSDGSKVQGKEEAFARAREMESQSGGSNIDQARQAIDRAEDALEKADSALEGTSANQMNTSNSMPRRYIAKASFIENGRSYAAGTEVVDLAPERIQQLITSGLIQDVTAPENAQSYVRETTAGGNNNNIAYAQDGRTGRDGDGDGRYNESSGNNAAANRSGNVSGSSAGDNTGGGNLSGSTSGGSTSGGRGGNNAGASTSGGRGGNNAGTSATGGGNARGGNTGGNASTSGNAGGTGGGNTGGGTAGGSSSGGNSGGGSSSGGNSGGGNSGGGR